jgi:hypothetical protein
MLSSELSCLSKHALAIALAVALMGVVPSDPDAAFSAARDAMDVVAYPRYADYQVVVRCTYNNKPIVEAWTTFEDLDRRIVRAQPFSAQEAANPHVARGINFGVGGETMNGEKSDDPIGLVTFAVNQDFGIARSTPQITVATNAEDVDGPTSVLQHIGRTGVQARIYKIVNDGPETIAGHATVHLTLTPVKDGKRYRLRELWIDAATSLPVRADVAGVGSGLIDELKWQIDFTVVDGSVYIAKETALETLVTDGGDVTGLTITFEDLRTMHNASTLDRFGYSLDKGITDP